MNKITPENKLKIISKIESEEEMICPSCGDHAFQEDDFEINEKLCIRNLSCVTCNYKWSENFKFI